MIEILLWEHFVTVAFCNGIYGMFVINSYDIIPLENKTDGGGQTKI